MSLQANPKHTADTSASRGTDGCTTRETYTHRGDAAASKSMQQSRSAETFAGFLIPSLQPEMRLLDCGCGAGSITIGLANIVAAGEVVGIDLDTVPLDLARALAEEMQCQNVRFEQASVYELPFADGSFDAVYSCAVLTHLRDPAAAVREMWRVLKPGGVIGITNGANRGHIFWPEDHYLYDTFDVYYQTVVENGGHPFIGQEMHLLLAEVGFIHIEPSARAEYEIGTEVVNRMAEAWIAGIERVGTAASAAFAQDRGTIIAAWRKWRDSPGAFFLAPWLQVLAWKPA
jgi:ubiquinone/menaquinone biosynthesis C-methylase UbiE